jgi:DNA ligase-1
MPDLADGETYLMQGSGSKPYTLKNTGGVYSCSCPAWRNQSVPIERRTCKHLRKLRGDAAEEARLGSMAALPPLRKPAEGEAAAPGVLLAEPWDGVADVAGWWLSEKLDGVRAYWDGKQFLSRQGNVFVAPDWFLEGLPDVPLDGELWIGRKQFNRTSGLARRSDKPDEWRTMRYVVFDAPTQAVDFEDRLAFVSDLMRLRHPPFAQALEQQRCQGLDHLQAELARVEALGGEGLMLRQPRSKYAAGRSTTLLKVKRFLDAEARVVGHQPGKGRHMGRMGALLAELPDGTSFEIGTGFSDAERAAPPPVGSVVTFRYQELTEAGVPRFASYVGVRIDAATAAAAAPKVGAPKPAAPLVKPKGTERLDEGGTRYFECTEGGSAKFWEVSVAANILTTRFGKIGTAGRVTTKAFPDRARAIDEAEKLIADKIRGGYVERVLSQ